MQLSEENKIINTRSGGGPSPIKRSSAMAFCPVCGTKVRLVTPIETEALFRANWAEILRIAEKGLIHRIHNSRGRLKFCLNLVEIAKTGRSKKSITLKPIDLS